MPSNPGVFKVIDHFPENDIITYAVIAPLNVRCFLIFEVQAIGALHTGTETGFTGSGSPIRIHCSLMWAPHDTQTICIALLD